MDGESFEIISGISEPSINVVGNSESVSLDATVQASPGHSVNQVMAEAERSYGEQHNPTESLQSENRDSVPSLVPFNQREVTGIDNRRNTTILLQVA